MSVKVSSGLRAGFPFPAVRLGEGLAGKVLAALLALGFFALLDAAYIRAAWTAQINSDNASILLEADDVLHGNVLLHGWTLTALTFYTTDLPFYVAGLALRGFSPSLLREVPALIFALVVAAAVYLAGRGPVPERRRLGQITTFVLLGLPSLLVPQIVLVGVNHVGTALFMILTLLALEKAEQSGRRQPLRLALFGLLLTLTVFGDSMAVVLLLVPIGAVSAVRLYRDRSAWPEEQKFLFPTLGAFLLARIATPLVHLAGGFRITDPAMKLTYFEMLPQNMAATVKSLLLLFRANFFGTDLGPGTAALLIGGLGLGFVLYSFRQGLIEWRRGRTPGDRVTEVLVGAMLLNLLAYGLDYNVVFYMNTLYSPPERYLLPFFVFSAILAGRLGVARVPDLRRFRLGLAALALAYGSFFAQQVLSPPGDLPAARLGRWLLSRGLHYGYGNFWCSNIVTGLTGGQVRVRAVDADSQGSIGQMYWFSKDAWYEKTPAHFLVFDASHYKGKTFYWMRVDMAAAHKTFGPPDETEQVGQYTVLIWKRDLTPLLARRRSP